LYEVASASSSLCWFKPSRISFEYIGILEHSRESRVEVVIVSVIKLAVEGGNSQTACVVVVICGVSIEVLVAPLIIDAKCSLKIIYIRRSFFQLIDKRLTRRRWSFNDRMRRVMILIENG
jgi:hypothetical protein